MIRPMNIRTMVTATMVKLLSARLGRLNSLLRCGSSFWMTAPVRLPRLASVLRDALLLDSVVLRDAVVLLSAFELRVPALREDDDDPLPCPVRRDTEEASERRDSLLWRASLLWDVELLRRSSLLRVEELRELVLLVRSPLDLFPEEDLDAVVWRRCGVACRTRLASSSL